MLPEFPQPEQASLQELSSIKYALDQSAMVAITDEKDVITYVNDKFCQRSQYNREELLEKTHLIVNSGFHPQEFFADLWSTITRGKVWHGEIKNKSKDGNCYWTESTIVHYLDKQNKPWQYLAIRELQLSNDKIFIY